MYNIPEESLRKLFFGSGIVKNLIAIINTVFGG